MVETKQPAVYVLCAALRALRSRAVWLCMLAVAFAGSLIFISSQIHLVYVRDDGVLTQYYTSCKTAEKILRQNNISVGEYDLVRFDGFSGKIGLIDIHRAFAVNITVDGQTHETMTTAMSLAQVLENEEIELGEFDVITPSAGEFLHEETDVTIQRVELTTTVVEEDIPYETVYKYNSLLKNGRSRTLESGAVGQRVLTYVDRVVDGELQERELVKTVVTRESTTEHILVGSDDAVSPLDFGIALDANGVPVSYKYVLTDQICTGYSGRGKQVHGASGMDLSAGYVAVRTSEIPYGTKLYITSADNSFVYGFAIAADTGVAIINGVIDLDLFYDTYQESRFNGRRICNVYVLE